MLTAIRACDGELPVEQINSHLIDNFLSDNQIESCHASTREKFLCQKQSENLNNIVNKYQADIERIPLSVPTTLPIEHSIDLLDDIPVNLPSRRLPYSLHTPVKEEINKLLANDFIENSDSQYALPIVPIVKKNGSVKIAIDYRLLNKKTVPRPYPIPHPDDLFNKVKGSKVFSVLDLQNGYFHIPVKESDRHKTAFILPFGKFQWKRLALGLIGAPYTFYGAMYEIFSDLPFVVVYFDDILIYSNTVEEHLRNLQEVFDRLVKYGLHINKEKSQLCLSEVTFLGFNVNGEGLRIHQRKIDDVVNFDVPQNLTDLRTFLGVFGFLRRFLDQFSTHAAPLFDLLKKGETFEWTDECQQGFIRIKETVSNAEILSLPDFSKPFALYTDASGKGIGFYLVQKHNGVLKPILFGGRVLSDAERKYAPTDQELLAVFYAVKRCYIYLYGHDFVVYTDHQPLTFLKSFKDIINKRFRWIQYLEEVGVKLVHVPGKENVLADFLSRNIKETPRWSVINSFAVEFKELLYSNDDIREEQHVDEHLLSIINKIKFENVKIDIPKEYRHIFS